MSLSVDPMGPGFFIFFQDETGTVSQAAPQIIDTETDDKEVIELVKIVFSFLERE